MRPPKPASLEGLHGTASKPVAESCDVHGGALGRALGGGGCRCRREAVCRPAVRREASAAAAMGSAVTMFTTASRARQDAYPRERQKHVAQRRFHAATSFRLGEKRSGRT